MPHQSRQPALRTFLPLLLVTLGAMLLAACRQPAVPTPTPAPGRAAADGPAVMGDVLAPAQLAGTGWQALAFGSPDDGKPVDGVTTLTLNFGADRYAGSGGCNWFLGTYSVAGDSMELNAPSQTVLQCTAPPDVMQQEAMYLSALYNVDEYRKLDDKLLAYATGSQLLLTFRAAAPVPLEGTAWSLKFLQDTQDNVVAAIAGTTVTATFAAGKITGSAGCNTYTGTYTLNGDKLNVAGLTVPGATKKTCDSPQGIMDQEAIYLANLAGAVRLVQTAGVLQLLNADDETNLAFAAP
jgi:heat shock protein HslJ